MEQEQTARADDSVAATTENMQVPQQVTGGSETPQTPSSATASSASTICGVCEKTQSKYKCPRCYLPYCSVACNRIHRDNHPPDEPKPILTPEPQPLSSNGASHPPAYDPSNPFRVLETSDKLKHLFRKYPCLTEQLLAIYAATQPPEEAPDKRIPLSLMQGVSKKGTWNHDIGIKNGKEALRKARRAKGEAGDAIREYSELVLHLINSQDASGQATLALQQQTAQEDSKLIERWLEQERR